MIARNATVRAAALLATATATALQAAPVPAAPAATVARIGTFEVIALRDELNVVPNDGSVFGKGRDPAAVAAVLRRKGAPTDALTLGVDALLVKGAGHVTLIDTGLGPKVGGVLQASLAAAGVMPDAVTDILITHSHGDHVGGLVTAAGTLAFPRATIRMAQKEWAWMQAQPRNAAIVKAIAASVIAFEPGREVVPGITALAVTGHTPGHSAYEVRSGAARLIDIGDTAHSAVLSLAEPGWVIGYDNDPGEGIASRKALLARLAASHEWVFAPHFPYPGIGRIVAQGDGFVWQPGMPR